MLEFLIYLTIAVIVLGIFYAYDGSRDVFHPLVLTGPILLFLYGWMPLKLLTGEQLDEFFTRDQLVFVQSVICLGVLAFVVGCLSVGCRAHTDLKKPLDARGQRVLFRAALVFGALGYVTWLMGVANAGGLSEAFSRPYGGGWDESGYVKDGPMLLFTAILLLFGSKREGLRTPAHNWLIAFFAAPWLVQALLASRRGPTFLVALMVGVGWFLHNGKRPPIVAMCVAGTALAYLILFLVVNREQIYVGSDFQLNTEVTSYVDTPHSGNEYIYGAGSITSYRARGGYFWGKRYLAQLLVRPIPSSLWPNKYESVGLGELMHNAGTGEGFADVLGWEGAPGSAPGLVADLWIEFSWLAIPVMFILGWFWGYTWKRAIESGGAWTAQYVIVVSLSLYLVMQTMEAVIFRLLILSVSLWSVWKIAQRRTNEDRVRVSRPQWKSEWA